MAPDARRRLRSAENRAICFRREQQNPPPRWRTPSRKEIGKFRRNAKIHRPRRATSALTHRSVNSKNTHTHTHHHHHHQPHTPRFPLSDGRCAAALGFEPERALLITRNIRLYSMGGEESCNAQPRPARWRGKSVGDLSIRFRCRARFRYRPIYGHRLTHKIHTWGNHPTSSEGTASRAAGSRAHRGT